MPVTLKCMRQTGFASWVVIDNVQMDAGGTNSARQYGGSRLQVMIGSYAKP
ncbi:hypothetical protein I380019A4_14710 [Sutterella wadsworthensis]